MANTIRNRMQLHQQNFQSVLAQVFNHQPISRIEISRNLALNKSTVSSLYNALKEEGYVEELGEGAASTAGGRKPVLLAINRRYGYTMNFDFGYRHIHVMKNNLSGDIMSYTQVDAKGLSIHEILPLIETQIEKAENEDKTKHNLLGISFAIHGTIDANAITYSPFLDMEDIDLVKYFGEKYDVPVLLENEANLAAVYERDFNDENQRLSNAVTISIHRGIGAGLIINKKLYRGAHGEAGEIGRSLRIGNNVVEEPRKVEDYCSEDAIINQISEARQGTPLDRYEVVKLYNENDDIAEQVIGTFVENTARIIVNVSNDYDPDEIFLNSPLIESLPELLPEIREAYSKIVPSNTVIPMTVTRNSHYATLLGGCALITRRVLNLEDFELNFAAQQEF